MNLLKYFTIVKSHGSLKNYGETLNLSKEENRKTKKSLNDIVLALRNNRALKDAGITMSEVLRTGSICYGTMVKGSDVDIVVFVNDFNVESYEFYLQKICEALTDICSISIHKRYLKIKYNGLFFDVLVGGNIQFNPEAPIFKETSDYENKKRLSASFAKLRNDFVKQKAENFPSDYRILCRFVKDWSKVVCEEIGVVKSWFLQLIAIGAGDELTEKSTIESTVFKFFKTLIDVLEKKLQLFWSKENGGFCTDSIVNHYVEVFSRAKEVIVLDPVDPSNNIAATVKSEVKSQLLKGAKESLDLFKTQFSLKESSEKRVEKNSTEMGQDKGGKGDFRVFYSTEMVYVTSAFLENINSGKVSKICTGFPQPSKEAAEISAKILYKNL